MSQDTTPPVFNIPPSNGSVACEGAGIIEAFTAWYNSAGGASISDNSGVFIVQGSPPYNTALNFFLNSSDTLCGNTKNVRVTWVAIDPSNNVSIPHSANFRVIDTLPPFLITQPSNPTHDCNEGKQDSLNRWLTRAGGARPTDVCSPIISFVKFTYQTSTGQFGTDSLLPKNFPIIPNNTCNWSINVSFIFKDECGNEAASNISTFRIVDTKPPVFSDRPSDVTVACNQLPPVPSISARDACSGPVNVTFSESNNKDANPNVCNHFNYTITRTWSSTDPCNNTNTHVQKITVVDNVPPIINASASITANCRNINNIDSLIRGVTDNCSTTNISFADSLISPVSCNYQVRRIYTARDVCNNVSNFRQIIRFIDKTSPVITKKAENLGASCDGNDDIQALFDQWLANRAGSEAQDQCNNGVRFFAANPNSYSLRDTTTFPGTKPTLFGGNLISCGTVNGFSKAQRVDFVYYDQCGNASVTSGVFGITDATPPVVNCPGSIERKLTTGCDLNLDIDIPRATDNCSQYNSPILLTASQPVSSNDKNNNLLPVNDVILQFGPVNPKTFELRSDVELELNLENLDANDINEFFNVIGEDGVNLGKTLNTPEQCGDGKTKLIIPKSTIQNYLIDGLVRITLSSQIKDTTSDAINDVCVGSRINAILALPIVEENLIKTFFVNAGDTLDVSQKSTHTITLSQGVNNLALLYKDCAGNIKNCQFTATIIDDINPTIKCPKDTLLIINDNSCSKEFNFPLNLIIDDNCDFTNIYSSVSPVLEDNRNITFSYFQADNIHLANNKVITFTNVPKIRYSSDDAILTINFFGDQNNAKEYFSIYGEGGYFLGTTSPKISTESCVSSVTQLRIPANIFNQWLDDNEISITAIANNDITEEGKGINPCSMLTSSQTIDNVSKLSMALNVRQAKLSYKLDNSPVTAIPNDSTHITLSAAAGIRKLEFITTDRANNEGKCIVNINIKDEVKPEAKCKNFIARIHPSGLIDYKLLPDSINDKSSDNCAIDTMLLNTSVFTCMDIGTTKEVTLTVRDKAGNTSSCKSLVRIEQTILKPSFTAGLCEGDTLKFFANVPPPQLGNIYTYQWFKGSELISTQQNPILAGSSSSSNGTYRLVLTGVNGCKAEGVMNVNINPISKPTISQVQDSYCDKEPVLLKTNAFSGQVTYEWYEGFPPLGQLIGTSNIPEYLLLPTLGVHNYYVIAKSPACISVPSSTKRVTIFTKPEPMLTSIFNNVCEGSQIILGTTTAGNNLTYTWSGPDNFTSNAPYPPIINNASLKNQGKYNLVVKIGECKSDTVSTTIAIIPKPGKPVIQGESTYCEGSTFSLVVNNIPSQELYTWIKDGVKFRVTQDNSLEIISVTSAAMGKWRVVVESNNCQSDTSEIKFIEIDKLTLVGASNNGPVCEGDSVLLTATTVPNATYSWTGPNQIKGQGQSVKLPAKSGRYFLTVKTTTGCENNAETNVEVNQAPVISALSNTSKPCMDGLTSVTFKPSVLPPGNYTYEWKGPNFTSNLAEPTINNVRPENNGLYILRVFNKNCPSKPDTSILKINLIPARADISTPISICEGDTLRLSSNSQADTFIWNTPLGIIKTPTGKLVIPNVKKASQGDYHLIIQRGGCLSTDFTINPIVVESKPLPVGIIGKNILCFGETATLTTNGTNIINAIWQKPNGSIVQSVNLDIRDASNADAGIYKVSVIRNGCRSDFSNGFVVSVKPEVITPTLLNNRIEFCSNESVLAKVCLEPQTFDYSYQWKNQATQKVLLEGKENCLEFKSDDFPAGTTFITIRSLRDGCFSINDAVLQIGKQAAPNIKANANIDQKAICDKSQLIDLVSTTGSGQSEVKWVPLTEGLKVLSPNSDRTLVSDFKDGLNIILLTLSKDGCRNFSTDTVKLYLEKAPNAVFDVIDLPFNEEGSFNILANDEYGELFDVKIIGSVDDGELSGEDGSYKFIPDIGFAGEIKLKYKLCVEGCDNLCDEADLLLKVGDNIKCQVPSIITPNEDGINDQLIIPCLNTRDYNTNELIIFNEWGGEVFRAKPYENNWSGTYANEPLPAGTYYYVFKQSSNSQGVAGFIIIQR